MTHADVIAVTLAAVYGLFALDFLRRSIARAAKGVKPVARIGLPADVSEFAVAEIRRVVPPYMQRMVAVWKDLDPALLPEPPALAPATVSSEVIVGWRAWYVQIVDRVPTLDSMHVTFLWPHGQAAQADRLDAQYVDHPTGIHAARSLSDVLATYHKSLIGESRGLVAVGTVALWGRVIEHERGYRAEFAYPQHLYVADEATAQGLRRAYGCEVTVGFPQATA